MSNSRKPRRTVQFFRLVIQLGKDEYAVTPFQPATTVARKAFRLRKRTRDQITYEVRVTTTEVRCSCPGYRFRRRCKHIRMLRAAQMLD
jgi:hypothetical protein